ncbi:hypothetical protein Avbf_10056 [Armadillidium vulgare]|nr:hypothetical protein Avbf_10056 [Armadillidium vulgare]
MAEIAFIVGAVFIALGALITLFGVFTCVNNRGHVYNNEDVDAMVAATVKDEQEQMKREEQMLETYKPGEKGYIKKHNIT